MDKKEVSDWHNLSKFQITPDVLDKRYEALIEILAREEKSYWIDLVRVFLGLKPDEKSVTHFVNTFQKADDSFPRMKIDKLIVVLSAIALICKIQQGLDELNPSETSEESQEQSNIELANIISSALINATFLNQIKIETKIPILQAASRFLNSYSSLDRVIDIEGYRDTMTTIEQRMAETEEVLTPEESLSVVGATQKLLEAADIQNEEINVLWWLFGEYSDVAGDYFANVAKTSMVIIGAIELRDLSQFTTEIPSSKHILRKVLSLSKADKSDATSFSIQECLESLKPEVKERIIAKLESNIDELTPCLNALTKVNAKHEPKGIKLNLTKPVDVGTLSSQFYKELVFLSAI